MNPTREQIGEWVRAAGWSGVVQTRDKWGETVYLITPTILEQIEDFAAFAYAAGLDAGLERAAEVCEQKRDKALAAQTNDPHDHSNIMLRQIAYLGAEDCAVAIRALKGEKE